MSCGRCAKVRAHLPQSIRARLEAVERRIEQARQDERRRRREAQVNGASRSV
jgi:hypothetical protein